MTARRELRGGPLVRSALKHPWLAAGAVATAIAIGAAGIVISGVVPIKASSGHWPITAWLLNFSKTRSVATHASAVKLIPLDDASLVLRGAGHYEIGCASCHGGPGTVVPPVMAAMTPPPPELLDRIRLWQPEELFYIVKHGIKFTGMPAWPAQERDDEVWAMVAFLRRMPDLDAAAYRTLVDGDNRPAIPAGGPDGSPAPAVIRDVCSRCHGADGWGRGRGAFPSLAGQRAPYLYGSLRAFAERGRLSGIMSAVAATLDDRTMREAAAYYEALPRRAPESAPDSAAAARGEAIATAGVPDRDVPACRQCHGPADEPRNANYPILAAQHPEYLKSQLQLFQQRRRGGSGHENLMHVFVGRLKPEDIEAATSYFGQLEWRSP